VVRGLDAEAPNFLFISCFDFPTLFMVVQQFPLGEDADFSEGSGAPRGRGADGNFRLFAA